DGAAVGAEEAVQHPERGRLAGAVGTEQPEHLPGVTVEIDAVDDQTSAETLDERARFEERGHAHQCTVELTPARTIELAPPDERRNRSSPDGRPRCLRPGPL